MAFAPVIALELSTPAPKARPAITATVTQAGGESAIKDIDVVFPTGFTYNEAFMPPRCEPEDEAAKACPAGSKIGTVAGISPLATAQGDVFVTEDLRLVSFVSAAGGVIRFTVVGTITIDPSGGFAVAFSGTPNIALTSLQLKLQGDGLGLVKNPATCGDFHFKTTFVSYDHDTVDADTSVPVSGCVARLALSRLRVVPSQPAAGKPVTLRWRATAATEATKVVLLRAGKRVRSRTATGTSARFASIPAGKYVARLRATGDGRTAPAKRLSFTVTK